MVLKRTSLLKKNCCDFSHELPDPIKKDLDKQGGIEGLLSKIPDSTALLDGSRLHQALADPIRLSILYALLSQPLCVCVIKGIVNIAASKLSYHLNILKEQELIVGEQQGNWIIYTITDSGRKALKCTERMGK
ncbi:MAG: metalloregulator ArsR/SmtB family transcription factor [Methanoregula sp.]|nr:metalloregulator ArsR/SmtB family transcription factor [Methanoregula sp.]